MRRWTTSRSPQGQAPRPLSVLRPTDKLPEPSEVLSGRRTDLEEVLNRRPRGNRMTWERYTALLRRYPLLPPKIRHPWGVPGESYLWNPLREICTVGSDVFYSER